MDELEKNVPETDELGEKVNENFEENSENALKEELEELRDVFQAELDKAMSGEESGEVLIQELDEIEEGTEEEETAPKKICECCGEKETDTSFGEDYPYCTDCRELMKANPINSLGIIMALVMFVVAGFTLGLTAKNSNDFLSLVDANSAYSEKHLVDAASVYETYLSSADESKSVSMKAVKNTIDIMVKLGYYTDAVDYIDTYYSESELKLPWNKKYVKIKEDHALLDASSKLINENFADALGGKKFNYKKDIEKIDKLIKDNETSGTYSQTFLEYAKYLLMLVHEENDEVQLEQLLKIERIDEGRFPWIYLSYISQVYARLGDSENSQMYFDKSVGINAQELTAYNSLADSIRFGAKPDADKILEVAQKAAAVASQNSYPTYYRIYAIAYLLKGDGEKAMNNMVQYLQSCRPTVQDFNLYAVCAVVTKDKESYKEAEDTLKQYGYKLGKSVVNFKNGKVKLEQVLFEKGGDI